MGWSLRLDGLVVERDGLRWLDELSLDLPEHGLVHVVGAREAGKSTLLRVIAGRVRPDGGRIIPRRRPAAVLVDGDVPGPERALVHDRLRAAVLARNDSGPDPDDVVDALGLEAVMGLGVGELSSAMRLRLQFADALMRSPPVLLVDEPWAGAGAVEARRLREALRPLVVARPGLTVIATATAEEAVEPAGELVVLVDGRVQQRGEFLDVAERPNSTKVAAAAHVPRLNLLEILVREGGIVLGPTLAVEQPDSLRALPEGRYTIGVAADRASLAAFPDALVVPATVEFVERDGGMRRLLLKVGRAPWQLVLPDMVEPAAGDELELYVAPDDLFVFGDTGAIERTPGPWQAAA